MFATNYRLRSKGLFDYALVQPRISASLPETLKIVSGYASSAMAVSHFLEIASVAKRLKRSLPLNVELVYGMTGSEGLTKPNHMGFVSLSEHKEFNYNGSFSCSYVKRPRSVHSKVYVWCKGNVPVNAFVGSANYSEQAFRSVSRTETLAECDPDSALDFFNEIKGLTINCLDAKWGDFTPRARPVIGNPTSAVIGIEDDITSPFYGKQKLELSLLTRNKDLGNGSCLNWGVCSDGSPRTSGSSSREPNQAYIGIPSNVQRSGFFPDRPYRFTVTTDDDKVLSCVRAQDNGKAIETPQDNSELGRYFRNRLGLKPGSYIKVEDMRRYGRLSVTFYKLDDDSFFMDFSKPNA